MCVASRTSTSGCWTRPVRRSTRERRPAATCSASGGEPGGHVPCVCYMLAAGPSSVEAELEFHQDEAWLQLQGAALLSAELSHIGSWHSHHRLALETPSSGDSQTVLRAMRLYRQRHFLLVIATRSPSGAARLRAFLYTLGQPSWREVRICPVRKPNPYAAFRTVRMAPLLAQSQRSSVASAYSRSRSSPTSPERPLRPRPPQLSTHSPPQAPSSPSSPDAAVVHQKRRPAAADGSARADDAAL